MTIKVEIKNNYGNKCVYPVCETAKLFAQIADTCTLTDRVLDCIRRIGYKIEIVTPICDC